MNLGSYLAEEEAARVHDDYVRRNKLSRPLHFPTEGEPSSSIYLAAAEARAAAGPPRTAQEQAEVAELANFMLEHFGAQPGALSAGTISERR